VGVRRLPQLLARAGAFCGVVLNCTIEWLSGRPSLRDVALGFESMLSAHQYLRPSDDIVVTLMLYRTLGLDDTEVNDVK
jgi:hypothetical protein